MKQPSDLARRLDRAVLATGHGVAWLVLAMMVVQVTLVLGRALFGLGSLRLHEAVIYANAVFIGAGIAYALARNGHTRIDVLRARMGAGGRCIVDLAASLVLLLPTIAVLVWTSIPYVSGAWQTLEGSRSVGGLEGVFVFKTILVLMPALLALPAVALALRAAHGLAAPDRGDAERSDRIPSDRAP